ncbi:hypothetical protein [Vibrio harveyi]|uniref:hypothetical protein n=1 Tax=Vibrio harveyi TaxID=669 RepID=UPI00237D7616|nr:hypothetical protein [Vibrio harveyi]HDM8056928.1 hypothetical protein [Vibrio harveyi]
MHLFNQAASTRSVSIVAIILLLVPWLYCFYESDFKQAIQVVVAIYSPIITGLTLYFLYRQLRLMAVLNLEQEAREERLRRLEFAKYWHVELKSHFNDAEVINEFYGKLTHYSQSSHREALDSDTFNSDLGADSSYLLANQLYTLLFQLRQDDSKLSQQALHQVKGIAFLSLPSVVWLEFERVVAKYHGSSYLTLENCVFLTEEDFSI